MAQTAPDDFAKIEVAARGLPFHNGTLFRVTRAGLTPSFLFATIHAVDPRLARLPPPTRDALDSAKAVALESLDFSVRAPALQLQTLAAPEAERASRLLSPTDFHRLQKLMVTRGFPLALTDRIKASALAMMVDLPSCAVQRANDPPFLDAQILARARARGIPVVGLETTAEQLTIADGLPPATLTALLTAVLAQATEAEDALETSVVLYAARRIGMLLAWTQAERPLPGQTGAAIPAAFLSRIIEARNNRMRDRLLPLLNRGGVFVAVGAVHIPGQNGLGTLIAQAGFSVERAD